MKNVATGPGTQVQPPMKVASEGYVPSGDSVYPANIPVETYIQVGGVARIDPLSR